MKAPRTAKSAAGRKHAQPLVIGRERFIPAGEAAVRAQVSYPTMLEWLRQPISVNGRLLISLQTIQSKQLYVEEKSLNELEQRYIRLPDGEPAGKVHIGRTEDGSGYLRASEVGRLCRVSGSSIAQWAHQRKGVPRVMSNMDAICDPIQRAVYVSEQSTRVLVSRLQGNQLRDWMGGR